MPASQRQQSVNVNKPRKVNTSLLPITNEDFGYTQARHLLLRAGFGGTDHQIRTLAQWGPERAVDYLINYEDIPAESDSRSQFDADIIRPNTQAERQAYLRARQSGDEDTVEKFRQMRQKAQRADRQQMREIVQWWIARMIQTPRPLEEKLTLFWHGHFATSYRTIEDSYHMYSQNRTLRDLAIGNFGDLLKAIVRDPAMLRYLNNNNNRKSNPNENLARELMELFSLGEGNYTERDIKDGAKALTGYTFDDNAFIFRKNSHDNTHKRILGVSGNLDADGFVTAILRSPACAPFICAKLYKFFVADISTDTRSLRGHERTVVKALSEQLQRNRYELKPVLRKLFLSRHFYDPHNMGTKIKSPIELLVGSIRTLNTPTRNLTLLGEAMEMMGQSVFYPPSVKGWDGGRSWINTSTLFIRQNTLVYLLTGRANGRRFIDPSPYDPSSLVPSLNDPRIEGNPPDDVVAKELLDLVLGRRPIGAVQQLTKAAQHVGDAHSPEGMTAMLTMITSMPEYQLC